MIPSSLGLPASLTSVELPSTLKESPSSLKSRNRDELCHQAASEIQDLADFCSRPQEQPLLKPVFSNLQKVKVVDAPVTPEMRSSNIDRCLQVTGECVTGSTGAVLLLCLRKDNLVRASLAAADGWESALEPVGDGYPEDATTGGYHLHLNPRPADGETAAAPGVLVFQKSGPTLSIQRIERDSASLHSVGLGFDCTPGLGAMLAYACISQEENHICRRELRITGISSKSGAEASLSRGLFNAKGGETTAREFNASQPSPPVDSRWDLEFRWTAASNVLTFMDKFTAPIPNQDSSA